MTRTITLWLICLGALWQTAAAQSSIDDIIRLDSELAALERRAKIDETLKRLKPGTTPGVPSASAEAGAALPALMPAGEDSVSLLALYGYAPDLVAELNLNGSLYTVRRGARVGAWVVEHIQSDALVLRKGTQRRTLAFNLPAVGATRANAPVMP